MSVQVRQDRRRGCGWRKAGGLYLVAGGPAAPCGKLPIPLGVCPTCHAGIKPTRGWTWIDGDAIAGQQHCDLRVEQCLSCPLSRRLGRVGLLWIGEQFYPTPAHWTREALGQGISRRISAVPKDFKIGETWVFVAHRLVIRDGETMRPAVFHIFKPTAVEYVVEGLESDEELAALANRGITPVRIERLEEEPELALAGEVVH